MSTVLAAVDDSATAPSVLQAAMLIAGTLDDDVRAVHVAEGDNTAAVTDVVSSGVPMRTLVGDAADALAAEAADTAVQLIVLGTRSRRDGGGAMGHVARAVTMGVTKPVLLVPPDFAGLWQSRDRESAGRFRRVLAPLDGSEEASDAVVGILLELVEHGAQVFAVHVFGPATMPPFWDHAGHAEQNWTAEFLARSSLAPETVVRLRTGDVAAATLRVASDERADLIVLGWSQDLSAEHARVVRDIVERAPVPVLLAPTAVYQPELGES